MFCALVLDAVSSNNLIKNRHTKFLSCIILICHHGGSIGVIFLFLNKTVEGISYLFPLLLSKTAVDFFFTSDYKGTLNFKLLFFFSAGIKLWSYFLELW